MLFVSLVVLLRMLNRKRLPLSVERVRANHEQRATRNEQTSNDHMSTRRRSTEQTSNEPDPPSPTADDRSPIAHRKSLAIFGLVDLAPLHKVFEAQISAIASVDVHHPLMEAPVGQPERAHVSAPLARAPGKIQDQRLVVRPYEVGG